MIVKIYDRDFEYTVDQIAEAQGQLNSMVPGVTKERISCLGRFELPLAQAEGIADLTTEQQTTFTNWAAAEHPDWSVVWR